MSDIYGLRVLRGEVIEHLEFQWPEGPEPRVAARLPGGIWDIPTDMFTEVGYVDLDPGTIFKAETPAGVGRVPKRLLRIFPPVDQSIEVTNR